MWQPLVRSLHKDPPLESSVSTATINLKLDVLRWESATMGRQAMKTFISALLLLQVRLLSLFSTSAGDINSQRVYLMTHSGCFFRGPLFLIPLGMPLRVWWHDRINKLAVGPSLAEKGTATAEYQTCCTGKRRRRGFSDTVSPPWEAVFTTQGHYGDNLRIPSSPASAIAEKHPAILWGPSGSCEDNLKNPQLAAPLLPKIPASSHPGIDVDALPGSSARLPPLCVSVSLPPSPLVVCVRELLVFSVVWADR